MHSMHIHCMVGVVDHNINKKLVCNFHDQQKKMSYGRYAQLDYRINWTCPVAGPWIGPAEVLYIN